MCDFASRKTESGDLISRGVYFFLYLCVCFFICSQRTIGQPTLRGERTGQLRLEIYIHLWIMYIPVFIPSVICVVFADHFLFLSLLPLSSSV